MQLDPVLVKLEKECPVPRPDFVIIGAMKCGTSTLAAQLGAQAGIFLTTPKEPNFFSDDAVFAKGLPWYEALFDAAASDDLKGEASTHYTKLPAHPDTVARMKTVLQAPRLVYMVRDPVARAVSHFIHEWTERRMTGDLEQAITTYSELTDFGLYAKQITPFVEAYGKEAICLTSLELLKADPQRELARVAQHIGYSGSPIWHDDILAQNVSSERIRKMPFHAILMDNPVARGLRRTLVPQALRTRLARARQMNERPKLSTRAQAELRARFAEDQAHLSELFPDVLDFDMKKEVS